MQSTGRVCIPSGMNCRVGVAARPSKVPKYLVPVQQVPSAKPCLHNIKHARLSIKVKAAEELEQLPPIDRFVAKIAGPARAAGIVTIGYIVFWYALNVGFNLLNKSIYKYFPFPWTVSVVHVIVGSIYCILTYLLGAKDASFRRPITGSELKSIVGPASMHALGHIAANVSFAAVAISLSHTVKTLEPAFNVALSAIILKEATPLPVLATLVPIIGGVALASAAELSFNWLGFLSAMASNLTFGFRAVWSKRAMKDIKDLGSTAIYAYTTLISVVICLPLALLVEGAKLPQGIQAAVAKFAFNTLERVSPVSHGVCNVIKRVVIIGVSVLFFGNKLTLQTQVGTAVAILGTYLYTEQRKKANAAAAEAAAKAA